MCIEDALSHAYDEGVLDLKENGLLVLDVLHLLESDHVRDLEDLHGVEGAARVPAQAHTAERSRACRDT